MRVVIISLLLILIHSCAFAYGNLWYDKTSALSKATKIVIFPISGIKGYDMADSYLQDKLQDKVKGVYFSLIVPPNQKSTQLIAENKDYKYLTGNFADEKARGAAVEEHLAADAYIICKVRENRVQHDVSPATWTQVTIEAWTEETGGPDGYKKWDESSYVEDHLVPEKDIYLNILDLDFYMYDTNGNKIMLFNTRQQSYPDNEIDLFRDIIKEYANEVKKANKACKGGK